MNRRADLAEARAEILLPAEPASPRAARAFVRELLRAAETPDDTIETVLLLTSELVTNALLHARSPMRLSLEVGDGFVRVEAEDENEVQPSVRPYAVDAPTGRGLALVDAVAERWGCATKLKGKSVWFEVGSRPSPEQVAPDVHPSDRAEPPPGSVHLRILGLPVAVYLETQTHNDALLREFALIAGREGKDAVPHRLLELIREVTERFGAESAASRRQIDAAFERSAAEVDLELFVPREVGPYAQSLANLLEEADEFCSAGDLLTLAAAPSVRRFRSWYLGEVLRQLDGKAPWPWPG